MTVKCQVSFVAGCCPDLVNILGDTDFDADMLTYVCFGFVAFELSRFPGSEILDSPISQILDFLICVIFGLSRRVWGSGGV